MRKRIAEALKTAVSDGDPVRIGTLRLMLAALRDRARARGEDGLEEPEDEAGTRALLERMVRQREESVAAYEQAARMDLVERERREAAIIREFLPAPLSAEQVEAAIGAAIRETGAGSIRDIGRVMARLKACHAGRMDFGEASRRVKALLD